MSAFPSRPLGQPIPNRVHAVSVSLPTLRDLIGYEKKDPAILRQVGSGYPRFVLHPFIRQLTTGFARRPECTGGTLWLTASGACAEALAAHLGRLAADATAVRRFAADGVEGVWHRDDSGLAAEAKTFLQNTGMFPSSRQAEDALVRLGQLAAPTAETLHPGNGRAEIHRVLRRALPTAGDADLFLSCSGMNAIHTAFRAVNALQSARGRTLWVQLGWLYRDTIAILRRFTANPARDYVHLRQVSDLAALERLFAERGNEIAGVFAETPTNPLIQTPDVPALAALTRRHGASLVLDPSIASLFGVDVLPYADLLVNSLTKFAGHEGDLLAGLLAVNPAGPDAAELRQLVARTVEPLYARDLARLAAEIGGYESFVAHLNLATPRVVAFLEAHPRVKRVDWALAPGTRANYLRIARSPSAVGGMLSFTLDLPLAKFYDAVALAKGPSFGIGETLISPFLYIAHYDLVTTPTGRSELAASGLDPELLRLSLGREPVDEIIGSLAAALD